MGFTGKCVRIKLTISSCYGSIPLTLMLMERDNGLGTLCHGRGLDYQQKVLSAPGIG